MHRSGVCYPEVHFLCRLPDACRLRRVRRRYRRPAQERGTIAEFYTILMPNTISSVGNLGHSRKYRLWKPWSQFGAFGSRNVISGVPRSYFVTRYHGMPNSAHKSGRDLEIPTALSISGLTRLVQPRPLLIRVESSSSELVLRGSHPTGNRCATRGSHTPPVPSRRSKLCCATTSVGSQVRPRHRARRTPHSSPTLCR